MEKGKYRTLSNRGGLKGIRYKWNFDEIDRRRFRHMLTKHTKNRLRNYIVSVFFFPQLFIRKRIFFIVCKILDLKARKVYTTFNLGPHTYKCTAGQFSARLSSASKTNQNTLFLTHIF